MFHNSKKETILKEEIQDNMLAIYLEDEQINYIPEKDSGYTLDLTKSSCNNGVTIAWDSDSWNALVNFANYSAENINRTKCTMYFIEADFCDLNPDAAVCIILALTNDSSELVYDETDDNNLRYIGANPNNYVWFNDELWRIIGVFNNIDDGTGKKESRLKIIKAEPYSTGMAWDTDNVNDWTTASLQEELNTTYLNSITSPYKEMISNALWNLGGIISYMDSSNGLASHWYHYERGTTVYSGRPTGWKGKIALMYPSDFGYATSGGGIMTREDCIAKELYGWNSSNYKDCQNNDWLYDSSNYQWTITPYSVYGETVINIDGYGYINNNATAKNAVSPVIYLSSKVKITSGDGSSFNPFILEI